MAIQPSRRLAVASASNVIELVRFAKSNGWRIQ